MYVLCISSYIITNSSGRIIDNRQIDNLQIDNLRIDNRQIDNHNLQIDNQQIDRVGHLFFSKERSDLCVLFRSL